MSKATAFVAFLFGAAAGSAATWYALNTKYQQFAEDEINEVREYYSSKLAKSNEHEASDSEDDSEEEDEVKTEPKSNRIQMTQITERQNYSGYFKTDESEPKPEPEGISEDPLVLEPRPYVVSPDEYAEEYGYECRDITLYADGVIADDDDDILEDPENVIGLESLNHFGEYAENTVYVRNDRLMCDYEISKDDRTYEEVLESKPYKKVVSR